MFYLRKIIIFFFLTLFLILLIYFLIPAEKPKGTIFGVTFSIPQAKNLGLDWKTAYLAVLDELKVRYLRLPVYWSEIEPEKDKYYFEDIDWQINEASKRGAKIILVIGRKQPRWPECFIPNWVKNLTLADQKEETLKMIQELILRYKKEPTIVSWQVENEALMPYGICPKADKKFLDREISLIRSLDSRPILLTDGGKVSFWIESGRRAALLGISLYKINTINIFGRKFLFHSDFIPDSFYQKKARLISFFFPNLRDIYITELQAEPWFEKPINQTSLEEQFKTMDITRFKKMVEIGRNLGFSQTYFWGVEWWYWLKETQSYPDFWNEAKKLF